MLRVAAWQCLVSPASAITNIDRFSFPASVDLILPFLSFFYSSSGTFSFLVQLFLDFAFVLARPYKANEMKGMSRKGMRKLREGFCSNAKEVDPSLMPRILSPPGISSPLNWNFKQVHLVHQAPWWIDALTTISATPPPPPPPPPHRPFFCSDI